MFSELIRRNSKRNPAGKHAVFCYDDSHGGGILYYPCAGSSGCDDLSERDGERCCKQAADVIPILYVVSLCLLYFLVYFTV